jgi:hypothetical protein
LYSPTYEKFRRECYDEEVNQIQQALCGAGRDPVRGLPQTLRESIVRAKVTEKQINFNKSKIPGRFANNNEGGR